MRCHHFDEATGYGIYTIGDLISRPFECFWKLIRLVDDELNREEYNAEEESNNKSCKPPDSMTIFGQHWSVVVRARWPNIVKKALVKRYFAHWPYVGQK